MPHAYGFNAHDLIPGEVCLDGSGNEWVYAGAVPSNPDEQGVPGTYYLFRRCVPVGFGGDVTYYMGGADELYTHHNGVEVGTASRSIKGVK